MGFLQSIPDSFLLLTLGFGLFFVGLLSRKVVMALPGLRPELSGKHETETGKAS
jgi:hypothetical protein